MNKISNLSIHSNNYIILEVNYGKRTKKSIEEKIQHKQEVIDALETRIEHEREELEALIGEQKQKEVEILYNFIKGSNLDVYEATEALKNYIIEHKDVLA